MSGIWDTLFQGTPPRSVTNEVTSVQGFPDWYQEIIRANTARASAVLNEPYIAYQGPRIAGITPDEQRAYQNVRSNVGVGRDAVSSGVSRASSVAGGPFNREEFNKYYTPYKEGVVDRIADLGTRNLTEKLLPGIRDEFIGAGQWGSSRMDEFGRRAVRDTQESILGEQANALDAGYKNAMDAYLTGQKTSLEAADQLGALGQIQQSMGYKDAAQLEAIGQQQRGFTQDNLDLAYGDFLEQRDLPIQRLNQFTNIVQGLPQVPVTSARTEVDRGGATGPAIAPQVGALAKLAGVF